MFKRLCYAIGILVTLAAVSGIAWMFIVAGINRDDWFLRVIGIGIYVAAGCAAGGLVGYSMGHAAGLACGREKITAVFREQLGTNLTRPMKKARPNGQDSMPPLRRRLDVEG